MKPGFKDLDWWCHFFIGWVIGQVAGMLLWRLGEKYWGW